MWSVHKTAPWRNGFASFASMMCGAVDDLGLNEPVRSSAPLSRSMLRRQAETYLSQRIAKTGEREGVVMERSTRTFKLRVSPAGFDVMALCHHRLVLATRTLLPYGATLTAAMEHLDRRLELVAARTIQREVVAGLSGSITLFVGAPHWVSARAAALGVSIGQSSRPIAKISVGDIYLIALHSLSEMSQKEVADFTRSIAMCHEVPPENIVRGS